MADYKPRRRAREWDKGPQRRDPDPAAFADKFFADNGEYMMHETGGVANAEREPYLDLVSSRGWAEVMKRIVIPIIHKVKHELLNTMKLDEGRRQGDIRLIALLGAIIEAIYQRAGEVPPPWIRSEFE